MTQAFSGNLRGDSRFGMNESSSSAAFAAYRERAAHDAAQQRLGPAPRISDVSPMAKVFGSLGPSAAGEITEALSSGGVYTPVGTARADWKRTAGLIQEIDALLNGDQDTRNPLASIRDVLANPDLSEQGRQTRVDQITSQLRTEITRRSDQLRRSIDAIESQLSAVMPKRPTGPDAAVRIADSKADLRMIFDSANNPTVLATKAGELLQRSLANGDDAMAWVITSPWPEDYLRSRWPTVDYVAAGSGQGLSATLGRVLDEHGGPDIQAARQALATITGPHGGGALRQLLHQLPSVIDRITTEARTAARAH